jgi:hypothetical protein
MSSLTKRAASYGAALVLASSLALAQTVPPPDPAPHPWRPAEVPAPPAQVVPDQAPVPLDAQQPAPAPLSPDAQQPANQVPAAPAYSSYPTFPGAPPAAQLPNPNTPLPGQQQMPQQGMTRQNMPPQGYGQQGYPQQPVPAHLTIKPGTYITVRVNQLLSSDRNQAGDAFFATLAEPIIVDGVVVAQRGQTVGGRITEAQKAGRVEGTSKLGVELINLSLVDGEQLPIQSQMINRNGPTSVGADVGAVATTTALGAAIGAAADWGRGAAIGAGAGAAAGILGVLLTRGRPTLIYPETALTFRIQAPVEIATDRAPQAFHYASGRDYGQGAPAYAQRPPVPAPAPGYYGPASYPYPYYWGPGLSVYVGPGYYRGYYRRW